MIRRRSGFFGVLLSLLSLDARASNSAEAEELFDPEHYSIGQASSILISGNFSLNQRDSTESMVDQEHKESPMIRASNEFQIPLGLKSSAENSDSKYFFDENFTRYQLVQWQEGKGVYNWLFLPGGPGVDSECLLDLAKQINVPGNCWLLDLPFNGTNQPYEFTSNEIYKKWADYLIAATHKFQNPILVGHSFGGFFPLFAPQLESVLKGLVILNSVPTLHSDLFAKSAQENGLPSLDASRTNFVNNPTLDNMKALYQAEAPYFFAQENRAKGIETIIEKLSYCLATELWFYTEGVKEFSEIKWVPQQVPTLIVGGSYDHITPLEIFKKDPRFLRNNIQIFNIPDAGHFPWQEKPDILRDKFASFLNEAIK